MAIPQKVLADTAIYDGPAFFLEDDSHVTALTTGGFAVGYNLRQDSTGVNTGARSFSATGVEGFGAYLGVAGSAIDETQLSIVGLQDGSTTAVWRYHQAGDADASLIAGRWDPKTDSSSSDFHPDEDASSGNFARPEVVELANGLLAFAWIDATDNEIKASIYESYGHWGVATTITVSVQPVDQNDGAFDLGLTALFNGNFVVSWRTNSFDAKFRIVDAEGDFVTGEMDVTPTADVQGQTDVTVLTDGRFVVTFYDESGAAGIYGKIFNEDGTVSVDRFQISDSDSAQAVTALKDGRFMVAYEDGGDIRGRIMNDDGTASSGEFLVNTEITGTQYEPSLDTLADGRVVVSWTDDRTGAGDVYYTILDPREAGVEGTGTGYADEFVGSDFADSFFLGGGNDRASGGLGQDQLFGGAGNDILFGNEGNDVLNGGAGADNIYGNNGQDQLLAGAGDDFLNGLEGNDVVDGGAGADKMHGSDGDDIFYVDNANDKTYEDADEGSDTVVTTISYALAGGQHIEIFATSSQAGTGAMTLTGNELDQRINGNNGSNIIYGGAGDDLLVGYGGNDNIEGQNGLDTLKGVSGIDKFVFRYSTIATAGTDHIADFGADDFIYVDHPSVTGPLNAAAFVAGADALDANDRFLYEASTGNLWFDQDGNGAAAKVLMAVLDNKFALTASDIILF